MPPLSPHVIASLVGRNQAPEKFTTVPFVAGGSNYIQRTFNLTRPLESFHFIWRGRVKFITHAMTVMAAEAPQSILQRIRITGTNRTWSNLTPIDMTGPTAFAWNQCYTPRGNSVFMSTNGGAVTRLPQLSTPIQTLVPGVTFGKVGDTYDLEIHWDVPVGPLFPPQVKGSVTPFLWFPQDWADTIQIQPFFGDAASFGSIVADGGDVQFTSYGSNTGSPTFDVLASYVILGPLANAVQTAVVVKTTNQITGPVQSVGSFALLQLLQKQKTTNVLIKAGTQFDADAQQPGVQVFETLSDTLLANTVIVIDNKRIRDNQSNMSQKEFLGRQFASMFPEGYLGFSFVDGQNPLTYFRGDNVPGGSTFGVFSDVTGSDVLQYAEILQEQVFGEPGVNYAPTAPAAGA